MYLKQLSWDQRENRGPCDLLQGHVRVGGDQRHLAAAVEPVADLANLESIRQKDLIFW